MALLNASQSGSFLTASREPAAIQGFGGAEAGAAQCLSVPSAAGLCPLLCSLLDCAGAGQPLSAGGCWQGAGQLGVLHCHKPLFSFCCWVTLKWLLHPRASGRGLGRSWLCCCRCQSPSWALAELGDPSPHP